MMMMMMIIIIIIIMHFVHTTGVPQYLVDWVQTMYSPVLVLDSRDPLRKNQVRRPWLSLHRTSCMEQSPKRAAAYYWLIYSMPSQNWTFLENILSLTLPCVSCISGISSVWYQILASVRTWCSVGSQKLATGMHLTWKDVCDWSLVKTILHYFGLLWISCTTCCTNNAQQIEVMEFRLYCLLYHILFVIQSCWNLFTIYVAFSRVYFPCQNSFNMHYRINKQELEIRARVVL